MIADFAVMLGVDIRYVQRANVPSFAISLAVRLKCCCFQVFSLHREPLSHTIRTSRARASCQIRFLSSLPLTVMSN
jgi:hypothetical protein